MSGFFMISRTFFENTVRRLSGQGFKILLDLFVSAPREVRFAELAYRFRQRRRGERKLDAPIMLQYLTLLADKVIGRCVPIRFVIFVLVGLFGMLVHLATLDFAFKMAGITFCYAQAIATLAMTVNFNLNNELTYRDRRLRGFDLLRGHLSFYLAAASGRSRTFRSPRCCISCASPGLAFGRSAGRGGRFGLELRREVHLHLAQVDIARCSSAVALPSFEGLRAAWRRLLYGLDCDP